MESFAATSLAALGLLACTITPEFDKTQKQGLLFTPVTFSKWHRILIRACSPHGVCAFPNLPASNVICMQEPEGAIKFSGVPQAFGTHGVPSTNLYVYMATSPGTEDEPAGGDVGVSAMQGMDDAFIGGGGGGRVGGGMGLCSERRLVC